METRNYYVPRTYYARSIINHIVCLVPCCVPKVEPKSYDYLVVTFTCHPRYYTIVENVLRREGWLE